jgi:hypothetical protein
LGIAIPSAISGRAIECLRAFAERRNAKVYHVEAIVQIRAEAASRDFFFQFAVSGSDYSGIYLPGLLAAHARNIFPADSAETWPEVKRQFCCLVEKYCPAIRCFQPSGLVSVAAGESALNMTEQLALQEGIGEGSAIYGRESSFAPRALFMNLSRQHVLTGASPTGQQYRRVARRRCGGGSTST